MQYLIHTYTFHWEWVYRVRSEPKHLLDICERKRSYGCRQTKQNIHVILGLDYVIVGGQGISKRPLHDSQRPSTYQHFKISLVLLVILNDVRWSTHCRTSALYYTYCHECRGNRHCVLSFTFKWYAPRTRWRNYSKRNIEWIWKVLYSPIRLSGTLAIM